MGNAETPAKKSGDNTNQNFTGRKTSPLRQNATQHEIYSAKAAQNGSTPFPRGPPMNDMTNVHPGFVPVNGSQKINCSPITATDEKDLVQLLFDMIQYEKMLEQKKQELVEKADFNLMDAYAMIDEKSLGWVSAPQLLTFLMEADTFCHKDDVYSFTRRFDRDNDSRLLYSDFCEAMTPKDTYYAHALNSRKFKYIHNKEIPKKFYFCDSTRNAFHLLFKAHFECEEKIEVCKKRLTRTPTFNIHDAFSCVDAFKQGRLTKDDLKRLMQRNGFHPTESELILLNQRFDRNLNGYINYQEFMDEILPRQSLLGEVINFNALQKKEKTEFDILHE